MKRILIFCFILSILMTAVKAEDKITGLENQLKNSTGQKRIELLHRLYKEYWSVEKYEKAIEYGKETLELAVKLKSPKDQGKALFHIGCALCDQKKHKEAINNFEKVLSIDLKDNGLQEEKAFSKRNMGYCYRELGQYDDALKYFSQAVEAFKEEGIFDKKQLETADILTLIGECLRIQSKYQEAIKKFEEAYTIFDKINEKGFMANVSNELASVYIELKDYDNALKNFNQALKLSGETKNDYLKADALSGIGFIYLETGKYDEAIKNFNQAIRIWKQNDNDGAAIYIANTIDNIGRVYFMKKEYETALKYLTDCLAILSKKENKDIEAYCLVHMAGCYMKMHDYKRAFDCLDKSLRAAEGSPTPQLKQEIFKTYFDTYSEMNDSKMALYYLEQYMNTRESLHQAKIKGGQAMAELEKRYLEKLYEKEMNLQRITQRNTIILFAAISIIVIMISLFLIYRYRLKSKAHKQLEKAHSELQLSREMLEEHNRRITDSIDYARKIQESILPDESKMKKAFGDYFVIFKPREAVSGDFYWLRPIDDKVLFAVVDCTGHGVPGAFMSMIGFSILDRVVDEYHILNPAQILEHVNRETRKLLQQDSKSIETADGMEVCLCLIDNKNKKVAFAGARRPLYVVKKSLSNTKEPEFIEIKGDWKSIGGTLKEDTGTFTSHEFDIKGPTLIYFTSDGFTDQQNPQGKKYGTRRLGQFIQSIASLDIAQQEKRLLEELQNYQEDQEQQDDITIAGIRLTGD